MSLHRDTADPLRTPVQVSSAIKGNMRELRVKVCEARQLHAPAVHDHCHAYCLVNCGTRQYRTPVFRRASSQWDVEITL
jgi:hypothetical protein